MYGHHIGLLEVLVDNEQLWARDGQQEEEPRWQEASVEVDRLERRQVGIR